METDENYIRHWCTRWKEEKILSRRNTFLESTVEKLLDEKAFCPSTNIKAVKEKKYLWILRLKIFNSLHCIIWIAFFIHTTLYTTYQRCIPRQNLSTRIFQGNVYCKITHNRQACFLPVNIHATFRAKWLGGLITIPIVIVFGKEKLHGSARKMTGDYLMVPTVIWELLWRLTLPSRMYLPPLRLTDSMLGLCSLSSLYNLCN